MKERNILGRLFHALWRGVDTVRKVLHLVVLLFIFSIVIGALSSSAPSLPSDAALLIQPQGALVEQLEGDPYDRAIASLLEDVPPQTLVQDIVDALKFARDDSHIQVVVLDLRSLWGGGLSKLQRIGVALDDFRESGKPVIAYADFYSQASYYLASRASEVYMHPDGMLLMRGFGVYRNYYKDAIDKLRVDWNVFRVGTHKSAVEPYLRNDMSDEDRASMSQLVSDLWAAYQRDVVKARELDDDTVRNLIDNFVQHAERDDATLAEVAVELGFVDDLLTHDELRDLIVEYAGSDDDNDLGYRAARLHDYVAHVRLLRVDAARDDNVAVIVAAGEILDGTQPSGTIGGDSTSQLLAEARDDESVKAVVLRVDSPGGSSFASELIRNEVLALQDAGKPVVASMGSLAASGGYWISMAADQIVASETTITGSIGIFGMFPTFQRSLDAVGVHTDGVGTSWLAGELRPDRAMSEQAKTAFQALINDGYDDFISKVATHRGMEKADVDRIAQGQVWTGSEALQNGLVDSLGNLDDAVSIAAGLASLEEGQYGRKYYEQELTPAEALVIQFLGGAHALGIDFGGSGRPSSVERLAGIVERTLLPLTRFNDPRGMYARCFCAVE